MRTTLPTVRPSDFVTQVRGRKPKVRETPLTATCGSPGVSTFPSVLHAGSQRISRPTLAIREAAFRPRNTLRVA